MPPVVSQLSQALSLSLTLHADGSRLSLSGAGGVGGGDGGGGGGGGGGAWDGYALSRLNGALSEGGRGEEVKQVADRRPTACILARRMT
jgi:hypothetical protein